MEAEERPNKVRRLNDTSGELSSEALKLGESSISIMNLDNDGEADKTLPEATGAAEEDDANQPEASEDGLPAPQKMVPALATVVEMPGDPPLSKSKMKKLRKKAEWESKRDERKAIRKEKLAAKRERKREAKQQEAVAKPETLEEAKTAQPRRATAQLPITIIIDCDFDDLMRDSERISLASQITRSYSDNKNSRYQAHLTVCSFGGELRKRFDTVLDHYKGWKNVRWFDCNFVETAEKARAWMSEAQGGKLAAVFSKYADLDEESQTRLKDDGEIVYLTSEADEDLTELKPYSTYIIGGLVDKNREKGICYKRATRQNVRTAKLPIGQYMDMQSRKVLTTNHVNEIMLKWLECGDWGEAFTQVIPKRKGGRLKSAVNGGNVDADDEDEAETGE